MFTLTMESWAPPSLSYTMNEPCMNDDGGAWVCSLAPSLGALSVAAELPVLDGTREVFIENPSMFQIHDNFQNRQVLVFQNFSLELLPNSLATRRRHVVVLAFTHCFDKQF